MRQRITVVETVFHQLEQAQPTSCNHSFQRMLATDEVAYSRPQRTDPQWRKLECGWINGCSQFVLINTGKHRVEVACGEEVFCVVEPGESMRLQPVNLDKYRVRSDVEQVVDARLFPA